MMRRHRGKVDTSASPVEQDMCQSSDAHESVLVAGWYVAVLLVVGLFCGTARAGSRQHVTKSS
jgi:hypothetical protein